MKAVQVEDRIISDYIYTSVTAAPELTSLTKEA